MQRSAELSVDDIGEITWDSSAFNSLVLPESRKEESLDREILQLQEKIGFLKMMKRAVHNELRKLGDRESQNLADLEISELLESMEALPGVDGTQSPFPGFVGFS